MATPLTVVLTVGLTALACCLQMAPAAPARADEIRDRAWATLASLNVPQAWTVTKGAGVTVAVLDSGVDAGQPDLAGSVTTGPDLTEGANPPGTPPKRLHGTNMASIIAGHGHGPGGRDGVIGVAPQARILSLRALLEQDEPGFALYNGNERFTGVIAKGIRYAVDHGAAVINLSLGKRYPTKEEHQAVAYAVSRGVVVVAASGNEGAGQAAVRRGGQAPFSYPASFPGVISVAAVTSGHRHAGFSNRNSAVLVSAPGVRIIGAGPGGAYWLGDGTSPATAFVSGIAALIKSKYPKLPPALVAQALAAGARYGPAGGYDSAVGFGEVDAAAALEQAGRLSGATMSGAGLTPSAHLGPVDDGPVQVVDHDGGALMAYGALGSAGAIGLITVALLLLLRARARRHPEEPVTEFAPEVAPESAPESAPEFVPEFAPEAAPEPVPEPAGAATEPGAGETAEEPAGPAESRDAAQS